MCVYTKVVSQVFKIREYKKIEKWKMNTRGEINLGKKTKWDNLVGGTLYHSDGHHSKWRRYAEIVSKYLSIPTAVQEFWKNACETLNAQYYLNLK